MALRTTLVWLTGHVRLKSYRSSYKSAASVYSQAVRELIIIVIGTSELSTCWQILFNGLYHSSMLGDLQSRNQCYLRVYQCKCFRGFCSHVHRAVASIICWELIIVILHNHTFIITLFTLFYIILQYISQEFNVFLFWSIWYFNCLSHKLRAGESFFKVGWRLEILPKEAPPWLGRTENKFFQIQGLYIG